MHYLASNLRHLRKKKGLTQADLAGKIGLKRSLIGAYEEGRSEPRLATLLHLAQFFSVDLSALVARDLSSKPGSAPLQSDLSGRHLRILPITVDRETDREMSTLVPVRASAGYLNGYGDVEFIEQLPRFDLPFPELAGDRSYRVFQVRGESMLPILPDTYIICSYVQDWKDVRNDSCYVLITRSEGVVYKRVINELNRGFFRLKSDNPEFDTYDVPVGDVVEIWKAAGYTSFSLPGEGVSRLENHLPHGGGSDLAALLAQLQADVDEIKRKLSEER